jgi:hypothetical protein
MRLQADVKAAFVPVDLVTNTLIAAGWHCGVMHPEGRADPEVEPVIYHSTGTLDYSWLTFAQKCANKWRKCVLQENTLPSQTRTHYQHRSNTDSITDSNTDSNTTLTSTTPTTPPHRP